METLSLIRPDDWHVHLRDGDYLKDTVRDMARYFGRAIVMPNLVPPITNVEEATQYRQRIEQATPKGSCFKPLMTLYITPETTAETIRAAKASGFIHAFKLYPAGATTNSDAGVSSIKSLYPVFEAMSELGIVLCVHGEVTQDHVDIFDREAKFIDESLLPVVQDFPDLKIIFEHITTSDAVEFVAACGDNVAATITVHHLLYNRNDMLAGGMRPLYYCLPVLKRSSHQKALIEAATSGHKKFFLGTDSAPHPRSKKENICGCAAGSYTAHAAIELYAEVFDAANKLENLEAFASLNGPAFYGLDVNSDKITLEKKDWISPAHLPFGEDELVPIRPAEVISWQVR